jgi:hypothetical protein
MAKQQSKTKLEKMLMKPTMWRVRGMQGEGTMG